MTEPIAPDSQTFLTILRRKDPRYVPVAEALLDWIAREGYELDFGKGPHEGYFYAQLTDERDAPSNVFAATTSGRIEILFTDLQHLPPFGNSADRLDLAGRLNAIEGVKIAGKQAESALWPSIAMEVLVPPEALRAFCQAFEWVAQRVRASRGTLEPDRRVRRMTLQEAAAAWDRHAYLAMAAQADAERRKVLDLFPLEMWPSLPLERYALGTGVADSFSRLLEFSTPSLGRIGGGNASKHLIFKRATGSWSYPLRFASEVEAWATIRDELARAFQLAAEDDFAGIAELEQLQNGSMAIAKAISIYNPDKVLPIFARAHRDHFCRLLGGGDDAGDYAWQASRRLLEVVREKHPEFEGWSPVEVMRFLYWWANPVEVTRIYKIAPGEQAKLWADCRANGYIRVGWDEVGDLRQYATKEEMLGAFAAQYTALYHGNQAKINEKAAELWTLVDLEPGDTIVANRGTSHIVGIGTVKDPGYEFRPDLPNFQHTIAVDWHDPTEREIDPIRRWAFKTVAPIRQPEYERILRGPGGASGEKATPKAAPPLPAPSPEPMLGDVERALQRKGQVILFGPPGTGKTYTARRFSVWWLLREGGDANADAILADRDRFDRSERNLSTAQAERRVWWMVANPAEWAWQKLVEAGTVDYRYGRLQRNYALLQVGDLVIGYQANPDKRIVALARVKEGLHETPIGPRILLEHVARIANGPTYEDLLHDEALKNIEPLRFRNQGTLFALTAEEADYLLAWLRERDPSLPELDAETGDAIGQLTRITFHPSYTYEDFVEGYKPVPTGTGQLDLRLVDGVFKRVCRTAEADSGRPYLVLIDEINRGNIPKIFGELITLIERDKRGLTVVLPQSGESFSVPKNVYVLGTMNTADRSIRLLDAALRRRFAFVELMPDTEPLAGGKVGDLELVTFLTELNRRIAHTEGREKQIGQSFLLGEDGQPVSDLSEFAGQFRHEILPLLQEYAYEDFRELADYLGPDLVDVAQLQLRRDVLDDPARLVAALVSHLQPGTRGGEATPDEPPEAMP